MQASDAFKLGFLTRCVEEGLSSEQTYALAKQASGRLPPASSPWYSRFASWLGGGAATGGAVVTGAAVADTDAAKAVAAAAKAATGAVTGDVSKWFWPALTTVALGPVAVGGVAAYLAHRATNTDTLDVDDVQQKELATEYDRMRGDLVRQKKVRDRRHALPAPKSIYL
jgi:hypothetical protein